MNQMTLSKYVGSLQQVAYVRNFTVQEGSAKDMGLVDVKNGDLRFQVATDKCLDIADFAYKGMNFNFLAKPGLAGQADYNSHGDAGRKSLMGGLVFTCGLDNTCLPCSDGAVDYAMHGRIRSIGGEHISTSAAWDGEDYRLHVSGTMREGEMFGKNFTLHRSIDTVYGQHKVVITDVIQNQSFLPEPMMILYHFNFGYPLLDEDAEVILPALSTTPRDEDAAKNGHMWNRMEEPMVAEPERVYLHQLAGDAAGNTFACLYNHRLQLGMKLSFNQKYLPKFVQWKSLGAGDYVMGLEPTNAGVYGRTREENIHKIEPFAKETMVLTLEIIDGADQFKSVLAHRKELLK